MDLARRDCATGASDNHSGTVSQGRFAAGWSEEVGMISQETVQYRLPASGSPPIQTLIGSLRTWGYLRLQRDPA